MEVISSRQNPTIKHVVKLLMSGKYRHKHGLAAAEGTHLGFAIWQSGRVPTQLIVAESAQRNVEVASILDLASSTAVEVVLIKDSLFLASAMPVPMSVSFR
jgi:TrmH family RNA methyltransferase